jgi:acyl carrier protein
VEVDAKDTVRDYIVQQAIVQPPDAPEIVVADDDDLLANGLVDSLALVEMVKFIEEEFSLQVAETDLTVDNFGTLKDIASYLEARRAQGRNSV